MYGLVTLFYDSLPLCQYLVAGDSCMLYCCLGCIRGKGGACSGLRADRERGMCPLNSMVQMRSRLCSLYLLAKFTCMTI